MISRSQAQVTFRNSASFLWSRTGQQFLTNNKLMTFLATSKWTPMRCCVLFTCKPRWIASGWVFPKESGSLCRKHPCLVCRTCFCWTKILREISVKWSRFERQQHYLVKKLNTDGPRLICLTLILPAMDDVAVSGWNPWESRQNQRYFPLIFCNSHGFAISRRRKAARWRPK